MSGTSITDDEYFILHSSALDAVVTGKCRNCDFDALKAEVSGRHGYAFTITVSCSHCNEEICQIQSSPRVTSSESSRPPFDVNRKLVEGFVNIGAGYTAMVKFGAALGMKVMDQSSYREHLNKLVEESVILKRAIPAKSRAAKREFYELENPEIKGQEIIDVHVSYEGSRQKRGFTSNYGFVSVIEINTGLVIDFETFSKYCHKCAINASELGDESEEYKAWYKTHTDVNECNKTFTGFSGHMESDGAVVLWKRSIQEANMRHTKFVSDGDAKSLPALLKAKPYGDDIIISKDECVNHIGKRMGTALRKVVHDSSKKKETLGGSAAGALTQVKIDKLQSTIRELLLLMRPMLKKMRSAMLATPYHYASTDAKPMHSYCPQGKDSWCFFQKEKVVNRRRKPSHSKLKTTINKKVFKAILPVYQRLSDINLLDKCKSMLTQNANESLHNSIWSKVPKVTFVAKGRLDVGVTKAVGEYNMGCGNMALLSAEVTERPASAQSMVRPKLQENAERVDRKRVHLTDGKSTVEAKKERVAKKNAKKSKGSSGRYSAILLP
ncbi:hypothetical protein FOCC_FOCC015305 [Frankliniella occidentalis]|nr:hypothetical protein FOCC_FOCC015305 [Frankliniella occidentalis]